MTDPEITKPAFVLVEPQLGENIGAAARIMGNFGLSDLRLVAPRDGWPNPAADTMSAGAFESAVRVRVFDTLETALADTHYVYATTARPRGMEKPVTGPRNASVDMASRCAIGEQVAILFGAERSGLPNEAVVLSDCILTYPINPAFSSLNLAQAVSVMAYEWGARSETALPDVFAGEGAPAASRDQLVGLFEHLEAELQTAGFYYPADKTPVMKQNLRNALLRARFTEPEVQTLRGVIKALAKGRGEAWRRRERKD